MKNIFTIMLLTLTLSVLANKDDDKILWETERRAAFYEIKAKLLQGKIDHEEAQKRWIRKNKRIEKRKIKRGGN